MWKSSGGSRSRSRLLSGGGGGGGGGVKNELSNRNQNTFRLILLLDWLP